MEEVVSQDLQLVSSRLHVIPEHLVMAGPAGPLNTLVAQEVEVSLCGMVDTLVHQSTSQGIAFPVLVLVHGQGKNPVWCLFCTTM